MSVDEVDFENMEGVILPGGMPGTVNLEMSESVNKALDFCVQNDLYIFAICAAPQILGHKGILEGKNATCYPGFETELKKCEAVLLLSTDERWIMKSRAVFCAPKSILRQI